MLLYNSPLSQDEVETTMTTSLPEEIVPDNDQTRARAEHLDKIRELIGNAYPNRFERSGLTESDEGEDTITSIVGTFSKHAPASEPGARPTPEQLEATNATLGEFDKVKISG